MGLARRVVVRCFWADNCSSEKFYEPTEHQSVGRDGRCLTAARQQAGRTTGYRVSNPLLEKHLRTETSCRRLRFIGIGGLM